MRIESVKCSDCSSFDFCKKYEKDNAGSVDKQGKWIGAMSPIRKCQHAIAAKDFRLLEAGTVLEVGCGGSKKGGFIRSEIEGAGNRWIGIDLKSSDQTSAVADVCALPFADKSFDVVIGNQTFEHWKDPGTALGEIFRVLVPQGLAFLNVPIGLHGEQMFIDGDFPAIEKLIYDAGFELLLKESWRKDHEPLAPYIIKGRKAYIVNFVMRKP